MYSANDSFSHMSFHHFMVTRSPNHMCAISCTMIRARVLRSASVAWLRKTRWSANVTQPGFSIAPRLKSGTNACQYSPNGYRCRNIRWYSSNASRVVRNRSSASRSRCSCSDCRQASPSGIPSCSLRIR